MAKGSKKGKKKGKKKKKTPKKDPNALTEVDRTFYELTITDLNRKLARLRSLTQELEEKNEELTTNLAKLDEDRNDIIIYLKRMLQEKTDEILELQERLRALEETRQDETEQYEARILDLENEYKQMHETLTSEIKLLEGKLNSLEEFRVQRDELMRKFEEQEREMEEQEKRHKNELYEIERKFIIAKAQLKKDMEARLLQLSAEFQDATEIRIAATTHRVIRENIAINNELDAMLLTHDRLYDDNSTMKHRDRTLRQEAELHEAEKLKALHKVKVQLKIIERLTKEHDLMADKLAKYQTLEKELHDANSELANCKQTVMCVTHKVRILEQNVHALRCNETLMKTELINVKDDNEHLTLTLTEAVYSIKEVLEVKSKIEDEGLRASKRESLLTQLFVLLSEAEKKKTRKPSLETVASLSATYQRGDLGFVPKSATSRSSIPTVRHIEAQTGASFEEFLAVGIKDEFTLGEETPVGSLLDESFIEEQEVEEESDVYFDEEEEVLGEDSLMDLEELEAMLEGQSRESLGIRRSSARLKSVGSKGDLAEPKREPSKGQLEKSKSVTYAKDVGATASGEKVEEPSQVAPSGSATKTAEGETTDSEATTAETSPLPEDTTDKTPQI